ncbi:MAG: chorismate-binding protein, partial [Maritimibacter sp.]
RFNVPIRTLTCHSADRITLNVGGGLVYDSTAEAEYREALLKARFTGVADL